MTEKQVEIQAQIHCEDGMYWAEVLDHPGLFASGETLDELKEALVEAWFLYTEAAVASSHIESLQSQASANSPVDQTRSHRGSVGRVDQLKLLVPA